MQVNKVRHHQDILIKYGQLPQRNILYMWPAVPGPLVWIICKDALLAYVGPILFWYLFHLEIVSSDVPKVSSSPDLLSAKNDV
jgi:hypothetical protein